MRRVFAVSLCLTGLLAVNSCRPFFQRDVAGRILALEGAASGTIGGKTTALTSSQLVPPGLSIASAPNARVDLMLLPGILIELSGETEIEVKELRLARDGNENIRPMTERDAKIILRRGRLFASVGEAQTDSHLLVETPAGSLSAGRVTTFKIAAGSKTRVFAVRGTVEAQPAGPAKPLQVPRGCFAVFPADEIVPQAAKGSGPEVQAEVVEILQAEQRLLGLEIEHGADFRPW